MNLKGKKIGIWGLGSVGQSAVRFLAKQGAILQVLEKKKLTPELQGLLDNHSVTCIKQNNKTLASFLEEHEYILPSPGINLRPHDIHKKKWLSEVDIFGVHFKKPTIAVTGTVGKTSVVTLLGDIINQSGKRTVIGGNIGTPLLDLIAEQDKYDMAVIELSSFQLATSRQCAAHMSIWTNIYPNHLDWHGTMKEYMDAKVNSLKFQCAHHKALLPLTLREFIKNKEIKSSLSFFSHTTPANISELIKKINEPLYVIDQQEIIKYENGERKKLATLLTLPSISFPQNWLTVIATLDILDIPIPSNHFTVKPAQSLEHRLEHVAHIDGIDFYNDSKATVIQATQAAVASFAHRNVILLLGGISKGVDRAELIRSLPPHVTQVICFGKEALELFQYCSEANRASSCFATLEQAYEYATTKTKPGDIVLLSPSGSSFDLFPNYQARGQRFKELVMRVHQKNTLK